MRYPTERRHAPTGRSARAALDPYVVDDITFTRSEILKAREEPAAR